MRRIKRRQTPDRVDPLPVLQAFVPHRLAEDRKTPRHHGVPAHENVFPDDMDRGRVVSLRAAREEKLQGLVPQVN